MNLRDLKTAPGQERPGQARRMHLLTKRGRLTSVVGQLDDVYEEVDSRD